MATEKLKKPSSKIVRNWLDNILNPLDFGLSSVLEYLKDNNYTWNWSYQNFTEIKTFREYFEYKYNDDFELLTFTEFKDLLDFNLEYDQKRADFNNTCINMYSILVVQETLSDIIDNLIEEFENFSRISEEEADYLRKSNPVFWIAEYLINNKKELPSHNVFMKLWNPNIETFFSILMNSEIHPSFLDLIRKRNEFENITKSILNSLKIFKKEMALKYGEPIAI